MDTARTKDNGENEEKQKKEALTRWREKVKRIDKPNPSKEDVLAVRELMRDLPEAWRAVWDLNNKVQDQLIKSLIGNSNWQKEAMDAGVIHIRKELGFEEAPMLEKLLIEQIVLCWIHYHKTHLKYNTATQGPNADSEINYHERRLNAAQRRYLRAIDHLARIRKMSGLPPLNINIAENQLNMITKE